jgi:hypothetical protein
MAKDYIRESFSILRGLMNEDMHDDVQDIINNVQDKKGDEEPKSEKGPNEKSLETVPYTKNDELLSSITQTCKERFGANFTKSKTPMLYYPKDGDVTLTGEISSLNNAVFQFRYKDATGNGCYVWMEPVRVSDETIKTLNVINGVYKNWKNELATSEDIKPMSMRNEGAFGDEEQPGEALTPGDDLD